MARVVVGVDGSDTARRALDVAAEQADRLGRSLLVVTAWTTPTTSIAYPISFDPQVYEQAAVDLMDASLAHVAASHPDLIVDSEVVQDDPRRALLSRVDAEDELVVGSQGLSGIVGLLVGSVASYCVAHAPCPVLVVPGAT
jgi:nucleotide-binding universal stress UspA family protein